MLSHVEVNDLAPLMADDEEDVHDAKRGRRHGEEVYGRRFFQVVQ